MQRYQMKAIMADLEKKMVLLAGPRQAGKTTLSKEIAKQHPRSVYLNYDHLEDRSRILKEMWPLSADLIILDEIHKMPEWKNYLKGLYDTKPAHLKILVTGSARLEIYRQAGDSLAGRYFLHHLLPLSPAELQKEGINSDLDRFLERGGFPEPYLDKDPIEAARWRLQYTDSLMREDVLLFENIHELKAIQLVFELLRRRVGSPVSILSISEDAHISPNTVKKYIDILEALYIVFRITPFSNNIARSLLKEPKIYFFDTGLVEGDAGKKLENLIAVCLLKHVLAQQDYQANILSLNYLRTKDGQEVDFCLAANNRAQQIIEVKYSDDTPDAGIKYFQNKYDLPALQLVKDLRRPRIDKGVELVDAHDYLKSLSL